MDILEVAIGLFFGYLVLSFVVTAANEMSAAWFRRRAWMLRKGITHLLDDDALAARLYEHPLIQGLSSPPGLLSRVPLLQHLVGRGPSYIGSRTFAMALLDVVQCEIGDQAGASSAFGARSRCSEGSRRRPRPFQGQYRDVVQRFDGESLGVVQAAHAGVAAHMGSRRHGFNQCRHPGHREGPLARPGAAPVTRCACGTLRRGTAGPRHRPDCRGQRWRTAPASTSAGSAGRS